MFERLLRWLGIRGGSSAPANPYPPGDSRREAFEALQAYAQAYQKRIRGRKSEQPRELVLREMPDDLLQGSRDLLKEYREQWQKVAPEQRDVIFLLPEAGRENLEQAAERAAHEIDLEMRRRGVKDRSHYYSAGERAVTGEVDRTYDTRRAKPLEGLGDEERETKQP